MQENEKVITSIHSLTFGKKIMKRLYFVTSLIHWFGIKVYANIIIPFSVSDSPVPLTSTSGSNLTLLRARMSNERRSFCVSTHLVKFKVSLFFTSIHSPGM